MMNIDSPSSRIEDPEQRKRIKNTPVGLKNIGNSKKISLKKNANIYIFMNIFA